MLNSCLPSPDAPLPDEPLRKRQRIEGLLNTAMESDINMGVSSQVPQPYASPSPARDKKYYMGDGDCVIQVEETLFKVRVPSFARTSVISLVEYSTGD